MKILIGFDTVPPIAERKSCFFDLIIYHGKYAFQRQALDRLIVPKIRFILKVHTIQQLRRSVIFVETQ